MSENTRLSCVVFYLAIYFLRLYLGVRVGGARWRVARCSQDTQLGGEPRSAKPAVGVLNKNIPVDRPLISPAQSWGTGRGIFIRTRLTFSFNMIIINIFVKAQHVKDYNLYVLRA